MSLTNSTHVMDKWSLMSYNLIEQGPFAELMCELASGSLELDVSHWSKMPVTNTNKLCCSYSSFVKFNVVMVISAAPLIIIENYHAGADCAICAYMRAPKKSTCMDPLLGHVPVRQSIMHALLGMLQQGRPWSAEIRESHCLPRHLHSFTHSRDDPTHGVYHTIYTRVTRNRKEGLPRVLLPKVLHS